MDKEPAVITGLIVGVVVAVIGVLGAFGTDVTDEQSDALVALVIAIGAAAPVVAGALIRRKVTPV